MCSSLFPGIYTSSEPTKDPVEWSTPGKASVDVSCYAFSAETKQKEKFFMRVRQFAKKKVLYRVCSVVVVQCCQIFH